MHALLRRIVDVRAEEVGALLWSFAYFFCLLCGYYILRPVREEMGITRGTEDLPWLFTATFAAMLAAVPLYGALVARWPRRRFIPFVYHFFALNLAVFFALLRFHAARTQIGHVFFVWLSVFNLFVVSVFWSFMADLWRSEQGKRLFGFIAAGGSAGALVGPSLTALLVERLGAAQLLLVSAAFLEAAVACVGRLGRLAPALDLAQRDEARGDAPRQPGRGEGPIGGGVWAGLKLTLRSPYLLGICGLTLLTTATATVLYLQQMDIVRSAVAGSAQRTKLFAQMDLFVNVVTIVVQALVTGRVIGKAGLAVALSAVPAVTGAGFVALAAAPTVGVVVIFQGLRRAAHYALERPAREILFTVVPREEKYKAKGFIDTVVYRGGDAATGWAYKALASAIGTAGTALATLPLVAAWLALNVRLARQQAARARGE